MPQSRSPVKHSGDVHPPELESGPDLDETPDEAGAGATALPPPARVARVARARPVARVAPMEQQPQARSAGHMHATFDAARQQVRARPWAAVIAALALGLVLARLFR